MEVRLKNAENFEKRLVSSNNEGKSWGVVGRVLIRDKGGDGVSFNKYRFVLLDGWC